MTKLPAIRSFEELKDKVFAFRLPRIILTGLDLDLFTVMGKVSWTIGALSKTLQADERGVEILCRNLASAGLLKKNGTRYQNGKLGRTVLNAHSPYYRGAYLDLMRRQWDNWSELTNSIRTGKPVEGKESESPDYRRSFSWAMHQRSMKPAKQVAHQVEIKQARSLLDLGGGPGTYALAFLAHNPKLRATVMDRPAALDVAKEIAASSKHGSRLSFLPLDFFQDKIQGMYDVIWLSNVIHIYSPAENTAIFKKIFSALNPKGRVFIQDIFLLDRMGLRPQEANLFAVTMLLFTDTGNTYKAKDVQNWLGRAGFKKPKNLRLKRGTGDWDGILIQAQKS
jgi:2-polyprenyl-3-methyl-5-hydroxy-6-metoxy-1,4-benzoquinol methylase